MYRFRLAPLCGVTDWPYRELCFEEGCECAYTEMVSAMGFLCAPKDQPATQQLLLRGDREKHLILQLFGRDPDTVAKAAGILAQTGKYDGIDLNMGCPAHKIAPSGEGCGLMRTPDTAKTMMEKTVKAVNGILPVSVKMRLGWDEDSINAPEIAKAAENAGISEITVHGRTRVQQYSGYADWERIGDVVNAVKIPVIGNGDIFHAADGIEKMKTYGTSGIMIGRGAMGNPWIFRDLQSLAAGETVRPVTVCERTEMILRHYDLLLGWKPEYIAVREMRKHIAWYLHGLRGAAVMRVRINRIEDPSEVKKLIVNFMSEQGDDNSEGENG